MAVGVNSTRNDILSKDPCTHMHSARSIFFFCAWSPFNIFCAYQSDFDDDKMHDTTKSFGSACAKSTIFHAVFITLTSDNWHNKQSSDQYDILKVGAGT
jgi:hypothetical protein